MPTLAQEIAAGDGLPIREAIAAARVPVPSAATLSRWTRRGLADRNGRLHRLEAVELGGALISSKAAVLRWVECLAAAPKESLLQPLEA